MRGKILGLICLSLSLGGLTGGARAQEPAQVQADDEEISVRGAFLTTRPGAETARKPAEPSQPAPTPKPRANTASAAPRTSDRKNTTTVAVNRPRPGGRATDPKPTAAAATVEAPPAGAGTGAGATFSTAGFSPAAIGLGYTLFMRDLNGDARRIDPAHVFRADESIRLSLEANTDGYLYVFHTENGGEPEMIFPDARLGRGSNYIRAHVPYEVPSNMEADERLRWFVFDATPAVERLYIVVARAPLPDVPTGETLVTYCAAVNHSCPWTPPRALWAQLVQPPAREQVAMSRTRDEGQVQTPGEREATSRGLGLSADAPPPSVIRMSASSTTGLLVTSIALTHK